MPTNKSERTPHERETLLFPNSETAQTFKENVAERMAQQPKSKEHQRAVVAEAVAQQFTQAGEAVDLVREPWTHTPAEHEEVQQLVNVAFQRDLGAAIAQARRSPHYPRNLDLLHDVLTGEMYDLLREGGLNKQPLGGWVIAVIAIVLITAMVLLLVVVAA